LSSEPKNRAAPGGETILVICFVTMTAVYLYDTFDLDAALMSDYVGPALFPQLIAILALVLCGVYFFQQRSAAREEAAEGGTSSFREEFSNLAPIGPILLYVLMLEPIGFLFATAIYVFIAMLVYGRAWLESLIYALSLSIGFFLLFYYALLAEIPMGRFINTERLLPFLVHLRRAIGGH
jgi:putative tricarboxylic transport membrane protein